MSRSDPRLAFLLPPRASNECRIDRRMYEGAQFQDVLQTCDLVIRDRLAWSFQDGVACDGSTYRRTVTEAEFEPAVTALQIALHLRGPRLLMLAGPADG
jgi:hypothetical protein